MDTPCESFSGGERARLALALIVWQRPNVLILDEPTNHLDLDMRHALSMALQDFEGAVVLVSHERQLIASVCDELLWYTVANVPSLKVICRIMLNGYVKHASNKSMLRLL